MTLLHVLQQLSRQLPFTLSAVHVHHGLSPQADQWLSHCTQVCAAYAVPFYHEHVQVDRQSGLGIEAAAREVRYQALARWRTQLSATVIVTAHHVQDQAETLLLQLVRGAGVKGLSAMASLDDSRHLWRPLLSCTKAEIQDYASAYQLQWVEDESNQDTRYDRNFVRQQLMPVLRTRYPQSDESIARSASHMAEAQNLLQALAVQDMAACDLRSEWMGASLDIRLLQALGDIRAKNLLRGWCETLGLRMPNSEQLQDYWQQLLAVKPHRYLHLPLHGQAATHKAYWHHYQGRLYCVAKPQALPDTPLVWQGERQQSWGGWLVDFQVVKGRGLSLARLGISPAAITLYRRYQQSLHMPANTQLLVHARTGGEQLQPDARRPRRELKVIFQMQSIPPWQRVYQALLSVMQSSEDGSHTTLVGLAPATIDATWQTGRNAYGLVISLSPLSD